MNKWSKCKNKMTGETMEFVSVVKWKAEGGESIGYLGEDKTLPKREFKKGFIVRFAHEEDKKHLMYLNEKTFNLSFDITNKL